VALPAEAVADRPPTAAAVAARRRGASARAWATGLLVVVLALGLRLAYVEATPGYPLLHDAQDYDAHARSIAEGEGYSDTLAHGRPTAFRPPGYSYLLGGVYRLAGVESAPLDERVHAARVTGALLGAAIVALIGVLAAQLWGPRVALVAAALAAVYVPLITVGGAVMSEPLFTVLMLGALVAAIAHRRSGRGLRLAAVAGLLTGLAILTRPNGAVLLPLLAVAVWARPRGRWTSLRAPAVLVVVAVLAVVPWTVRNAVELDSFIPVTTQLGSALAGTYNDQARNDPVNPAAWRSIKHIPAHADLWRRIRSIPEPELERRLRARAGDDIAAHPAYVAEVGFWNTVRLLDLAGFTRARQTAATVGIDHGWADAGVVCFWLFALVALAGACTRRARRSPAVVWAVPVLMAAGVVFLTLETPRYRMPIDPFVVLLAALAVTAAARSRRAS
jgi:4-amino-4-deoxy-L-arabinose transferase-like glycosyltransferase